MRKIRLIHQLLQYFSLKKEMQNSYRLGGFTFGAEKRRRDFLAKPILPDAKADAFFLDAKRQNFFGNGHRRSQSRRFNPKEVY